MQSIFGSHAGDCNFQFFVLVYSCAVHIFPSRGSTAARRQLRAEKMAAINYQRRHFQTQTPPARQTPPTFEL
jgi:hypothetical protein